jgi:membrane-associated phospholipid phosphatase
MIEILRNFDLHFFYFINQEMANGFFDFLCPILRDKRFLIACYLLFAATIYYSYPKQFIRIAMAGALTFFLTDQISSSFIKPMFQRLRPCNDHFVTARLIIEHCGSGYSFVSSHAANSFGMATFLAMFFRGRKAIIVLAVWATLVCFSQVYVGIHYPADVAGGGILGVIIGSVIEIVSHKAIFTPKQCLKLPFI